MRAYLGLVVCAWLCAACGTDEGILVATSTDPATVDQPLDELRFLIGVADGTGPVYVKDGDESDLVVGVAGRDLVADPYRLLLRDGADGPDPSAVMVAAIGLRGEAPAAFGAFENPQTFVPGLVLRRDIVLAGDADFDLTDTGCVTWGDNQIADPDDLDCDNDPAATDCDDTDPTRSQFAEEICGNGIDDDCDDMTDEGCANQCEVAADCQELSGDPPCGEWKCNAGDCEVICPDCSDGDLDGYGTGTGCAGPDCDDADDTVFDNVARACYSGDGGTEGVGTCRAGVETCVDGVFGPCVGEVVPSGEACNGEDDDCDGAVDEDLGSFSCGLGACATSVAACTGGVVGTCTPSAGAASDGDCDGVDDDCDGAVDEDCDDCVRVALGGNDTQAVSDGNVTPFATIQAAIDWAAGDSARPPIVCVAPGATCGAIGTFTGAVTMADGISVYGGYRTSDWLRCSNSTTEIITGTPTGVVFPSSISELTVLDGVRILRAGTSTTTGVTIDGAENALVANVTIDTTPSVTNSYGVNLINGARATITRSRIFAGNAAIEAIAIRSIGSSPTITANCNDLDASGRCDSTCFQGTDLGIRARQFPAGTGDSFGVLLQDSPDAIVETSSFCGGAVDRSAAVRVVGESEGVVIRGNNIQAFGGKVDSHGVWLEDCAGNAPWVVDNFEILSAGETPTARVDGVRAVGDCHPVIDSNRSITGGSEGGAVGANGVHCLANGSGVASQCVVLGNALLQGSKFGYPPTAVGVRCDDDSCMRVANNTIDGHTGVESYGLYLDGTGAFVDANEIVGGCGTAVATGVYAVDSFARIQNNFIRSGGCEGSAGVDFRGLHAVAAASPRELDVHSNTIDGGGAPTTCRSAGLVLAVSSDGVPSGKGSYRNNIFVGGVCATSYGVEELQHLADPRVFESNNLDPRATPTALYLDETSAALTTAADVNALADAIASGNLSVDSQFASYPANLHITTGSLCVGAGTGAGAPSYDVDGDARDAAAPDIGADEL